MTAPAPAPALAPAALGFGSCKPADPCVLVIAGASGDLTRRELVPALFDLFVQGLLPQPFTVLGFSRSDWSDDEFRERTRTALEQAGQPFEREQWDRFAACLGFVRGGFTAPADGDYATLKRRITEVRRERGIPDNVLLHLAAPPQFFGDIVSRLGAAGLAASDSGWRRVVIEKPFGTDEASAAALDRAVRAVFVEDQIYRVDHFLGKETVQNMLVVRFANPSFEPIWNRAYIDHVQITVAERIGIGTRADFYEQTGVLRDMVQNHLLQLLSITAIEPPTLYDARSLRDETAKVIAAIRPIDTAQCVGAQYAAGRIDDRDVPGYRGEARVSPKSAVRTYAALKLQVDNWRWAGVPFYLRTGKRMARQLTEVAIRFKPTPHMMFPVEHEHPHGSWLTFRLQPEEGIIQTFAAKQPGPHVRVTPVTMTFSYASTFGVDRPPRAYAWLLLDAMTGDQTLFTRSDWIREAWHLMDPLIAHWESSQAPGVLEYAAGSWGPAAADDLLRQDGRKWSAI